ncbi:UNVERIFIED_CONTAM: PrgI family protein [Streptococcus canis]|uniref:PrgI family protein n=1 Tax=Streptococcus canis TaxID=1329 RepID=A0AAE4Q4I3_STRCB|nr:PrgI family protein [Streptococcus canis]MDV5976820.1 PrgI family protein [Streptococcus canis]QKG74519.1 PrgI family protein [Streptococcus canis]QKG75370.1 PrgI family protein [Streptococcus canis]GFE46215.1 hypothetical protein ScFU6_19840 [Streptococcus canis]GMX40671.1 hypothetical protein ScKU71_18950 [Streptococcus canis]
MAQKLGSEFLRPFDQQERLGFLGRTKRQWLVMLGIGISIALSIGLYLIHFPIVITYMLLGGILTPVLLYGSKKDLELKERYRFLLTIQKRSYQTDYQYKEVNPKDAFQSQFGVTEVDQK